MSDQLTYWAKLYIFKRKWKYINKHNLTTPGTLYNPKIVTVGKYTYGTLNVYSWGAENESLEIGSFVSIAEDVKFLLGGDHKFNSVSTYPFKVNILHKNHEATSKGPVVIKDDVWIGMDSMILSGVKIGQGAIIAANSIVTKNIPPYAIVGGVPAKVIKFRFEQNIIDELLNIDFSKIDESFVKKNIDLLYKDLDKTLLNKILNLLNNNHST